MNFLILPFKLVIKKYLNFSIFSRNLLSSENSTKSKIIFLLIFSNLFNNLVLKEFEKFSSNFLLLLFVSLGFKFEENLLKKIQLEKSEYNSLTLKSTFVINNLIESKAF